MLAHPLPFRRAGSPGLLLELKCGHKRAVSRVFEEGDIQLEPGEGYPERMQVSDIIFMSASFKVLICGSLVNIILF